MLNLAPHPHSLQSVINWWTWTQYTRLPWLTGVSAKDRRGNSLWSRAAGGLCHPHCLYDITAIPASVCVVILSRYCWVVHARHVDCLLWCPVTDTDAISAAPFDCAPPPPPVSLSVSSLSPPSSPSFTTQLDVSIIDNREIIDFKETIINF